MSLYIGTEGEEPSNSLDKESTLPQKQILHRQYCGGGNDNDNNGEWGEQQKGEEEEKRGLKKQTNWTFQCLRPRFKLNSATTALYFVFLIYTIVTTLQGY